MTKTILLLKYGIESVYEPFIGDNEVSFLYGFNEERVRMTESYNTMERQKTYVANCEFITESESGLVTEKSWTFLTCPTGVFAVVEKEGNTETLHYILKDHQGSWTVVTDAEGTVEQELSYDAWGNLRDPDTWCVDTSIKPMFDRGFTGHEHITAFGLINMNGRCYDPMTSHFLSVDAYVQDPTNAQAFNRYAYCAHNPLRYTDPTGWLCSNPNPIRQSNSANYNAETTWQSDDINDVLWGRSVHPCANSSSGYINGTAVTSTGYTEGNEASHNSTSSGIPSKPIKTEEGYYLNIFTGKIEYNSGGENLLYDKGLMFMASPDATVGDIYDITNNWGLESGYDAEGKYYITDSFVKLWNLWHAIPAMATFFAGMTAECFISTMISFVNIAYEIKISNQIRVQEKATKTVELLRIKEGGNVTVMKGENPIFRVHQPGTHGQEGSSITVFEKMKNPNTNQYFYHPSNKVQPFSNDSYWKLRQAEKKRFGYYLKTRGGR